MINSIELGYYLLLADVDNVREIYAIYDNGRRKEWDTNPSVSIYNIKRKT